MRRGLHGKHTVRTVMRIVLRILCGTGVNCAIHIDSAGHVVCGRAKCTIFTNVNIPMEQLEVNRTVVLPFKNIRKIVDFLNEETDILDHMPSFLNGRAVSASMVAASNLNLTDTEKWFETGRLQFLNGQPRPARPNEATGYDGPESAAYYGWMIERARKIDFLSKWIARDIPKGTPEYEEQLTRSIAAMDAAYGLVRTTDDISAHDLPPEIVG